MAFSICRGKRDSNPNKCKKLASCKVAHGKKRTFCRKKNNRSMKNKKTAKKSMVNEAARLKGVSNKTERKLQRLRKQLM